jgi:hypothetical protein
VALGRPSLRRERAPRGAQPAPPGSRRARALGGPPPADTAQARLGAPEVEGHHRRQPRLGFGAFTPAGPGGAGAAGGTPSWASAYPHSADLFLSATFECDDQGRPLRGPGGGLRPRRYGLLVRWDEVLYLEVSW